MVEGEKLIGLAEKLAAELDSVHRPKDIIYREKFDMTTSGKIKRDKL